MGDWICGGVGTGSVDAITLRHELVELLITAISKAHICPQSCNNGF